MGVRRPFRRAGQGGAVEGLVERLGSQPLEQLVLGHRLVGSQQHQAEAACVVETNLPALVGLEHDMVVPLERMLGGARGIVQGHAARHAEMDDQGVGRRRAGAAGTWPAGRWPAPCGPRPSGRTWPAAARGGRLRRWIRRTMRWPTSRGTRPRRTVSTSGSSGMGSEPSAALRTARCRRGHGWRRAAPPSRSRRSCPC